MNTKQSKIPKVTANSFTKQSIEINKNDVGASSKLQQPKHFSTDQTKTASSNLIHIKSKSSLDLKPLKELIDTRPQSVLLGKSRSISRSTTKHELLVGKESKIESKIHKPGFIPRYISAVKNERETHKKTEAKGFEKCNQTEGDSEKVSNFEKDLLLSEQRFNELKIELEKLSEENKTLKENKKYCIQDLEAQIAEIKKENNRNSSAMKKLAECLTKEQNSNMKLREKLKSYEVEDATKIVYLDAAKKMSDKKLNKEQQKLMDSLSSLQERCKELENRELTLKNDLDTKEVEVKRLTESLIFAKEEKSTLFKQMEDVRLSELSKINVITDTQDEMRLQAEHIQMLENQNSDKCKEIVSLEAKNEHLKQMMKNTILDQNSGKEVDHSACDVKLNATKKKNSILQKDLETAQKQLRSNDDVIQFNQSILKIRTDLIEVMQEKEKSTLQQISDLQKQIIHKDETYKLELRKWEDLTQEVDMNDDINNKSGVLGSLYPTLSSQQMELTKKDQTILQLKQTIDKMRKSKKRREELLNQVFEKSHILSR